LSSNGYHDFPASLCLRPIDRGDIVLHPSNASQRLFAPPSFLSASFLASDNHGSLVKRNRQSPTLDERARQYPPGGIAIYNWNAGPGAWWRFLKPDQPSDKVEGGTSE
jgi:hypothetical protein